MYNSYKIAGNTDEYLISASHASQFGTDFNPSTMFKSDQTYNASTLDNPYVMYEGVKIFTSYVWPIGDIEDNKEWLETAFEKTGAVGLAALLFIYHKEHKMMDYIPQYLSNPSFMSAHGEKLKEVLTKFMSGHVRNDIMFRYQRLLQTYPIMFDTMLWLDSYHQDTIGSKMYRFGIPNAFPFIKPENITAEMIHEAIVNAKTNAAKRLVPPGPPQFVEMYIQLLRHDGHDLVNAAEIVQIALWDWKLAYAFIKAKDLTFNEALSILMTFVHKRQTDVNGDNYIVFEKLWQDYGPSDQWPDFLNVIAHVNAVTGGKATKVQVQTTHQPQSHLQSATDQRRTAFE